MNRIVEEWVRVVPWALSRWVVIVFALLASCSGEGGQGTADGGVATGRIEEALTAAEWPTETVVATNSFWLQDRGDVVGAVAVTKAASQTLSSNAEAVLAPDAVVTGNVKADTLVVMERSVITAGASYNTKTGSGTIQGGTTTPLSLPLAITIPTFPSVSPGTQNVTVNGGQQQSLSSGNYATVTLNNGTPSAPTKLTLTGGLYQLSALTAQNDTIIECSAACEIRVNGRASFLDRAKLRPKSGVAGLGVGNVQLLVKGSNGASGPLGQPSACQFGNDSAASAYIFAPNGTLRLGDRISQRGKLVAKDVWLGQDADSQGKQLPIVTDGPHDKTVNVGQSAGFSVTASGSGLSYQWQKNGVNISGATGSSYTLAAATLADNGNQYRVIVSTTAGSVTSNTATLTVTNCTATDATCNGQDDDCNGTADEDYVPMCVGGSSHKVCVNGQEQELPCAAGEGCAAGECKPLPVIASGPEDLTVNVGESAGFSVAATGTGLSYQWQRDGANIPGATGSDYTIASAALADDGRQFRVVVSNIAGSVTSSAATLTVTNCIETDVTCDGQDDDCNGTADDGYVPACVGGSSHRVCVNGSEQEQACGPSESCTGGDCVPSGTGGGGSGGSGGGGSGGSGGGGGSCTGDPHCALQERLFFSVKTPTDVPFADLALVADGQLALGPATQIVSDGGPGFAPIANVGLGLTTVEDGVAVGGVHGGGDVSIMSALVAGDIVAGGDLAIDPSATVSGDTSSFSPFERVRHTFSALLPTQVQPVPAIGPGQTQSLEPGRYSTLRVQQNETFELASSGEYFFDALMLEDGVLRLNNTSGPIFVYVLNQLVLDGGVDKVDAAQNVLLAFTGTSPVFVRSAFEGTLIAPRADLTLEGPTTGTGHVGAFFGRNIEVEGAVTILARPPAIDCQSEASMCRGSFACPLDDRDGDAIPDCQEESDDDPWTNSGTPNGAVVTRGPLCAPSAGFSCSMIDESAEAAACIATAEETRDMVAGWSWSSTGTTNLCDPAFGFIPGWSTCSSESAISVVGILHATEAGNHCFEVTSGADGCTSLFVGDVEVGQTSDEGSRCYDLEPGEHPITVLHQGDGSDDEIDIRYCFGAASECVPEVSLPPDVLRPRGCGTDGAACDDEVTTCTSDSSCLVADQQCPDEPNGALFNLDAEERVCVPSDCVDNPSGFGCSAPAATCQSNADCPLGTPCAAAGAYFGDAPDARYCLDPICSDLESEPPCGSLGTKCGLCACVPDCSSATCGGDLDDGCGGFCQGTCANPQPGEQCKWDIECPEGQRCSTEFGRCIDPSCFDSAVCDPEECGADVCPEECIPDYSRQECGPDPVCGEVLATCAEGEECIGGTCRLPVADRPELPPRLADNQPTTTIGSVAGSFGVSSQGKATYSIPLTVPPSVGGSQPQLALSYTGDTRGGNAGVGWNINVGSKIERCSKTAAQREWPSPPTGAPDDAYCLDGQRLVLVDGTPGEDGAEYRTERESFQKIVYLVRGSGDTQRDLWVVSHKGGGQTYYGRSRVLPNTDFRTTQDWAITEQVSRSSIVIRYRYDNQREFFDCAPESQFGQVGSGGVFGEPVGKPCVDAERELVEINYGGTDRLGPHSIHFLWTDYSDSTQGPARELLGVHRLIQAEVFFGDQLLRSYRLNHGPVAGRGSISDPDDGDFLLKVEECVPDPVLGGVVCKPPTAFDYYGEPIDGSVAASVPALFKPRNPSFEQPVGPSTHCDDAIKEAGECKNTASGYELLVDANGDGLLDLLYAHDHWSWESPDTTLHRVWEVAVGENDSEGFHFATGQETEIDGVASNSASSLDSACIGPSGAFDYNGDGDTDIVDGCASNGEITWYLGSHPDDQVSFLERSFEVTDLPAENDVFVLDRNGDGYAELVACDRNSSELRILSWAPGDFGSSDYEETVVDLPEGARSCSWEDTGRPEPSPLIMDANGDGVAELLVRNWHSGSVFMLDGAAAAWKEIGFKSSSIVPDEPDAQDLHSRGGRTSPPGTLQKATFGAIRAFRASGTPFVDLLEHVQNSRESIPQSTGRSVAVDSTRLSSEPSEELYLWRQSQFSGWQPYAVEGMFDHSVGDFVPMSRESFDRVTGVDLLSDRREGLLGFFKEEDEWRALAFHELMGVGEPGFIRRTSEDAPFPARYFRAEGEAGPSPGPVVADFDGDGALDVLLSEYLEGQDEQDPPSRIVYPGREPERYRLKSVKDGLGNLTEVAYDTSGEAYTRGECNDHRSVCLPKVGPVVHHVANFSSRGLEQTTTYSYEDARAGRYGRGWLGFGKRTVTTEVPAGDETHCDESQLMSTQTTWFDNGRFDYNDFGDDSESDEDEDDVPDDEDKAIAEAANNARRVTAFDNHRDYLFAGTVRLTRTESPEVQDGFPEGHSSRFRQMSVHFYGYRRSEWERPFVFPLQTDGATAQAVGTTDGEFEDLTRTRWFSGADGASGVDAYGNRRYETRLIWERAADGTFQKLSEVAEQTSYNLADVSLWELGQVGQRSVRATSFADGVETDQKVRVVEFEYDSAGRVSQVIRARGLPDLERTTELVYDEFGNVVQQNTFNVDSTLFRTSLVVYDAEGLRAQELVGPTQLTSSVDIDAATGLLMSEVDANGVVARHTYDAFGMQTEVETASGSQSTRLLAASSGTPTAVYEARTTVSEGQFSTDGSVEYDSTGRALIAVSDGLGAKLHQSWTYNCQGRLEREESPHPATNTDFATSQYFYDPMGRLTQTKQPNPEGAEGTIHYQYGTALSNELTDGRLYAKAQRVTDLDGITSESYSDAAGRVVVAGRAGALSMATYGPFGEVTGHDGPSANEAIVTDDYGRLVSVTDPDLGTITYVYDAFDRPRRIERPGAVDYFDEYDALDRLTQATHNVLELSPDTAVERFFYDFDPIAESEGEAPTVNSLGKLVRSVRETPTGTVSQTVRYESPVASPSNRGLPERTTLTVDAGGTTESFETRYEYLPGTAKLDVLHYPESEAGAFGVRHCYDEVGALEAVVSAEDDCSSTGFWRRTHVMDNIATDEETLGNGVIQSLTLQETTYALKGIKLQAESDTSPEFTYTYQPGGRLQTEVRTGTGSGSSYNRNYVYTPEGVLDQVIDNNDTADPLRRLTYLPGQRLEQVTQRDEPNIGVFDYEPGETGAIMNRPSAIGANNFLYDGRGNQTYREGPDIAGGVQSIAYNDLNLPESITTGEGPGAEVTSFLYGPGGGRAYANWAQAQRQTWHVGDAYEKQRTSSGGNTTEVHRYSVFAGGERVAEVKRTRPNDTAPFATQTTYLHHDRLGSLVASTNADGEVTGEYTYGVFGQPNEALPVPYGYTGHRYESELGLTDAGGRFYDAKFGIFLSPDPIGPLSGGSTFGNRYSYAGYDPINFVDPTGFQQEPMSECTQVAPDPDGTPNILCVRIPDDPGPDLTTPPDVDGVDCPVGSVCVPPDQVPDSTGNSGSTSTAKPHIVDTADEQLFGVAGTPYVPSSGELLEDYYTPQGTMVTCSVAGPGCSDGSGYVFGWTDSVYTQRGRELGSSWGGFAADAILIPAGRTLFDSNATSGERALAVAEIGVAAATGAVLSAGAELIPLGRSAAGGAGLAERAAQVHRALDPIAQAQRTTAALDTSLGRIIAGGARDLTPAQRALLGSGEIAAKLPGAHAEVTALNAARGLGATPEAMAVTRAICPACAAAIETSGGTITSPTTVIWLTPK